MRIEKAVYLLHGFFIFIVLSVPELTGLPGLFIEVNKNIDDYESR